MNEIRKNDEKKYSSYSNFNISHGELKQEKEYEENNKLLKDIHIDDIKKQLQNNLSPKKIIFIAVIIILILAIIISIIISTNNSKKDNNHNNENNDEIKNIENCLSYDKLKNECLECKSGYYLPNDDDKKQKCQKCSVEKCDKCTGTKFSNKCETCASYLTPIYEKNEIIFCNYTCQVGENEKCKTCDEIKNMCSSCNSGYNLFNGKCKLDYSIQSNFYSDKDNQKVNIINSFYIQYIVEMEIDNVIIKPSFEYIFPKAGNHILYLSMNISKLDSLNKMFYEIENLTSISFLDNFDTQFIEDMSYMFYGCKSLTSINLSTFNTKNVKFMMGMFSLCSSLTSINLSKFNTEKLISMGSMFSYCSSLNTINLSNFQTENVEYMSYMFHNCHSLSSINLSNFNTLSIVSFSNMFSNCSNLNYLDISSFINYGSDISIDCILCNVNDYGIIKVNKNFIDKIKNEIPTNWNISIIE